MNKTELTILNDYIQQRQLFEKLQEEVSVILDTAFKQDFKNIHLMGISSRIKDKKSLQGKLLRKSGSYSRLSDITDILGFRIVSFFVDDVDKIGNIVEQLFEIDYENSVDKRKILSDTSFGYLSLHYVASLKGEYSQQIKDLKFEIQIRTGLQHMWAEIEHDIGYKSKFSVTHKIRRQFSRIAGLLEVADEEFVLIRNSMANYVADVQERIKNDKADELELSTISLDEFMKTSRHLQEYLQRISAIDGAEITQTKSDKFIEQLDWLEIKTLGDLEKLLENYQETALKIANNMLGGLGFDILSSSVALRYLCMAALIERNYTEEKLKEFYSLTNKDKNKVAGEVKFLLNLKAELVTK